MNLLTDRIKPYAKDRFYDLLELSINSAAREQRLKELAKTLERVVPDISNQYSTFKLDSSYRRRKARTLHAFQISLVDMVIGEFDKPVIVDIGDSSGTHIQYIKALHADKMSARCLSVNCDAEAIERIRKKGIEAIHARAEDLSRYQVNADIFLCFETLEHIMNPCAFLHDLATKTAASYLIVTVPYMKVSRVGLHHLRHARQGAVYAENTHIFELCPEDWKLIAGHSGWRLAHERIYRQYPRSGPLALTRDIWRRFDFEGFYGMILKRDPAGSAYVDW